MAQLALLVPLLAMNVIAFLIAGPDIWVHVANILYLFSYSVRDILWLRALTIVAIVTMMPFYFTCSDNPMWTPIAWQTVFVFVNFLQIVLLVRERWPVTLHGLERDIYERVFRSLSPGEFRRLLTLAEWRDVDTGTRLVRKGEVVREMLLLCDGAAVVVVGDKTIAHLESGQFIGEMSFLTEAKASADVEATAPSKLVAWEQEKLKAFLERQTAVDYKLRGTLNRDMVRKLKAAAQEGS